MVVNFDVPTQFAVLLKNGEETLARFYPNVPELHQSYSYYYPIPEHRDHADLYGRVLRNAVCRSNTEEIRSEALLQKDIVPHVRKANGTYTNGFYVFGLNHDRMKTHLDGIVEKQLTELKGEQIGRRSLALR